MEILRLAGRVVALIIGLIGSAISLAITIITVVAFHTSQLFDVGGSHSHGFIGFLAFLVGLIGSLVALFSPTTGAVLLVIAGLVMLYVAGLWGIIPLVILVIAALIAWADRGRARA